jgi:hypothetical protein
LQAPRDKADSFLLKVDSPFGQFGQRVSFGSEAVPLVEFVCFGGESGHGLVKRVCKRNCERTTRHSTVSGIASQDGQSRNEELQQTVSYWAAQVSKRILELESRCAVIRTAGSNPTLSAFSAADVFA